MPAPRRRSLTGAAPLAVPSLIARKRDGGALADGDIHSLIAGAAGGAIPDYQIAALLMAIVWRGLSPRELRTWTRAMIASGDRLRLDDIPGRKVDKHSTGGVGDKVSICLAPLVAACGVPVPMISGRALGHTGGTLDKLESIPGFRSALAPAEFRRVLRRCGLVLAGQTERLVPADRVLYALRDATATVESLPLIASSILSKKVAEGADALLMDVKVGAGAFLPSRAAARRLARTLVALGRGEGLQVRALLTAMDQPLGREVGNAGELREAIEILAGGGPPDTRALTVRFGAEMLVLGRAARDLADGARRIEAAIASGAGWERFARCIDLQGGDRRVLDRPDARLPRARRHLDVLAARAGVVTAVDARAIGNAATLLGAGRLRKEDRIDHAVGITLHHQVGASVDRRQPLATLHVNDRGREAMARALVAGAFRLGAARPRRQPLILETIAR
ncbi:MAG TPA: thymidine phosphorylase [Polyangia bacterium]|nr:thymidine phosphorylase [Polyangia bacterium]